MAAQVRLLPCLQLAAHSLSRLLQEALAAAAHACWHMPPAPPLPVTAASGRHGQSFHTLHPIAAVGQCSLKCTHLQF